ncbi:MAG: hypothetical protein J1D86_01325 [Alistipes sp.]|nr:hypothetical protein [Alistipes sp.]
MTGIRKRITVGFTSIAALLFFSGMISFFELSHLSNDTEEILKANSRNIELARAMIDAADEQNRSFIHLAVLGRTDYDSLCRASMVRIEQTLEEARREAIVPEALDSLSYAVAELRMLTDDFLVFGAGAGQGYVDVYWYDNDYRNGYEALSKAIGSFMTSTQNSLAPRTEQLKKNAYRSVMPVLISLAVVIAVVLMFHFFITIYCINPILNMNKSLGNYLQFRTPFKTDAESRDEMLELGEKINILITESKRTTKE